MYNFDEMKSISFRISKRINKEIQRDNIIHPLVKNYFTESSLLFYKNEDDIMGTFGVKLNKPLNNEYCLDEIGSKAYMESLQEIEKVVNRVLLQEKANNLLDFKQEAYNDELFNFNGKIKNKYTDLKIQTSMDYLCEIANFDITQKIIDDEKKDNATFALTQRSYYREPSKEGEAITKELMKEIELNPNDGKFIANPFNKVEDNDNSSQHDFEENVRLEGLSLSELVNYE